jgi:hypothetical protein
MGYGLSKLNLFGGASSTLIQSVDDQILKIAYQNKNQIIQCA